MIQRQQPLENLLVGQFVRPAIGIGEGAAAPAEDEVLGSECRRGHWSEILLVYSILLVVCGWPVVHCYVVTN